MESLGDLMSHGKLNSLEASRAGRMKERLKTRHCEGNCHVYSVVHTVVKRQQTYKPQAETIPNYVIPVPYRYVYRTTSTILVVLLVLLDCTLVLSVLVRYCLSTASTIYLSGCIYSRQAPG